MELRQFVTIQQLHRGNTFISCEGEIAKARKAENDGKQIQAANATMR